MTIAARGFDRLMSVASLPMYDLPEIADQTRAFWRGLAGHLRDVGVVRVPETLAKEPKLPHHWLSDDLLFSQTCGYPFVRFLGGRVKLVATPCYCAPGCKGADYCSIVVVHRDAPYRAFADLRGKRAAVNNPDSQSGYNALRALVAPMSSGGRFFADAVKSGSHVGSLSLVAAGKAEVAAIDCVTFALLSRYRPAVVAEVRELCRTARAPGLPYIMSKSFGEAQLKQVRLALGAAINDPSLRQTRSALLLEGIRLLPETEYIRISDMEAIASARNCHAL